ncbi:MAG: hypothetical protein M8844_01665 [marine benthic group bacterium]|nr:hypothetical protein [Gemmatimonadota bacterium]
MSRSSVGRIPERRGVVFAAFACLLVAAPVLSGCAAEPGLTLPEESSLQGLYGENVQVSLKGNVVDVVVGQPADQLRRGGATWAKVGPYIYLFSPQTRKLFEDYTGLGGVRVTTVDGRDRLVARALLPQGALNSVTWNKAIGLAGRARLEGTERPSYILELIDYGEELADHEYGSNYVKESR